MFFYGAGSRVRTRDPLITNQVLYQLSYTGGDTGYHGLALGAFGLAMQAGDPMMGPGKCRDRQVRPHRT